MRRCARRPRLLTLAAPSSPPCLRPSQAVVAVSLLWPVLHPGSFRRLRTPALAALRLFLLCLPYNFSQRVLDLALPQQLDSGRLAPLVNLSHLVSGEPSMQQGQPCALSNTLLHVSACCWDKVQWAGGCNPVRLPLQLGMTGTMCRAVLALTPNLTPSHPPLNRSLPPRLPSLHGAGLAPAAAAAHGAAGGRDSALPGTHFCDMSAGCMHVHCMPVSCTCAR